MKIDLDYNINNMETSVNNRCRAFTSLEQSKKLAEILPHETADMWFANGIYLMKTSEEPKDIKGVFHCWSLVALLDVLPDEVGDNHYLTLDKEGKEYCCCYEDNNGNSFRHTFADNPVDACYEMIIKLKEKGFEL